ncbi:MAG TPA: glutamate formimidoyltransferase [Candidatus Marinimicrobia bacterium]|jgi:glutamate formiminotransferase/formiminotetrahydrofolate cyclodeaminase|nr:glutamate formimidoyltransferase [Candidatus Neomarinimicrobiota bacterium]MDP7217553.1 glutamate formimidoyltransferase [Candidatus Neomarinimicrobiota bacterium]MDP7437790.1 glutamate formimidoyltransferase [Candidatus Neomarinimicrobiota bacterium]HBN44984.1 glutamate formimidoyltransferase [Candidatus Neomarinimicrobiota bacterium]HJL73804.1 glutamate formimidoyltransferase [Candidatus Neomarinimicrobiota bacterium]|tara:strand:+ start:9346 stop:11046 length:1701 start_codon:yes stop_codon:yes gene_type:complete
MNQLVECVPNFSEGRDLAKIKQITKVIETVDGITLLDVDPGRDTNRAVVTFVGSITSVEEAAFQAIAKAADVIDMRNHSGAHARMGATDVCPFIPVSGVSIKKCVELSKRVAERVGRELSIPVYLYEESTQKEDQKSLPLIRAGEYEGLSKKLKDPHWKPDFGPAKFNAKSGATVMGCREFLIAYNINLNTKDQRLARDIAFELREKGRSLREPHPDSPNLLDGEVVRNEDGSPIKVAGLFKDLKGVGWYIDEFKRAQISLNFNNYKVSTIHDVFDKACELAVERGIRVTGSELVGLMPKEALLMAGHHYLKKQLRTTAVPENDIIECAVQSLGLNDLYPFKPEEKIVEFAVGQKTGDLIGMTSEGFVDELSSNSPAPGGGSVAALAGSLGAALVSMVAALTHEKKGFESLKDEMDLLGNKAQQIKDRLAFLVDEDTHAFNAVMDANRLAGNTDDEKSVKKKAILKANKYAIDVPLETAELAYHVLELAAELVQKGNPNSVSDVGVASETALAAVRGGCMNVLINLPGVKDKRYRDRKKEKVNELLKEAGKLERKIFRQTMKIIDQ